MRKKILMLVLIGIVIQNANAREDLRAKYEDSKSYIIQNTNSKNLFSEYEAGKSTLKESVDGTKYFSDDVKSKLKGDYGTRKNNYKNFEENYSNSENQIDNYDINDYSSKKTLITNKKSEMGEYLSKENITSYSEYEGKITELQSKDYKLNKENKYITDLKGNYNQEKFDKDSAAYKTSYKYTEDYKGKYANAKGKDSNKYNSWSSNVKPDSNFINQMENYIGYETDKINRRKNTNFKNGVQDGINFVNSNSTNVSGFAYSSYNNNQKDVELNTGNALKWTAGRTTEAMKSDQKIINPLMLATYTIGAGPTVSSAVAGNTINNITSTLESFKLVQPSGNGIQNYNYPAYKIK
jgi:hypothetical protein